MISLSPFRLFLLSALSILSIIQLLRTVSFQCDACVCDDIKPKTHAVDVHRNVTTKTLWLFWSQGFAHLESLGKDKTSKYAADFQCVRAWEKLNRAWNIQLLDQARAMKLAPKYAFLVQTKVFNSVTLSDLLRLELLTLYGGVWSDTSNCPFRKLDDFVPAMLETRGYFVPILRSSNFAGSKAVSELESVRDCHTCWGDKNRCKEQADAMRSCDTWFMAAARPHIPVFEKWLHALFLRMIEISTNQNDQCPYYVTHCMFTRLRMMDAEFEAEWQAFQKAPNFWRGKDGHMCFGMCFNDCSTNPIVSMTDDYPQKDCFFVKKQSHALLDYVKSPSYLAELRDV